MAPAVNPAPNGSRLKAEVMADPNKTARSLFDDRNQARALLFKGSFVAVRSASARAMTANHKSRSLSVITERDIA